jgi:uncharacterized coiled-coil protein SlyX
MKEIPEYHFKEPDYRRLTMMMFFKNAMIVAEAMALQGKPQEQIEQFASEMARLYSYVQDVTRLAAEQEKRIEALETTVAKQKERLERIGTKHGKRAAQVDNEASDVVNLRVLEKGEVFE